MSLKRRLRASRGEVNLGRDGERLVGELIRDARQAIDGWGPHLIADIAKNHDGATLFAVSRDDFHRMRAGMIDELASVATRRAEKKGLLAFFKKHGQPAESVRRMFERLLSSRLEGAVERSLKKAGLDIAQATMARTPSGQLAIVDITKDAPIFVLPEESVPALTKEALDDYGNPELRKLVDQLEIRRRDLSEREAELAGLKLEKEKHWDEAVEILGSREKAEALVSNVRGLRDAFFTRIKKAAREMILPPGAPMTPANTELVAMAVAHFLVAMHSRAEGKDFDELYETWLNELEASDPTVKRALDATGLLLTFDGQQKADYDFQDFLTDWKKSAYARLEVGARLAAALALTDAPPAGEVRAPWKAWSLLPPPGLLKMPGTRDIVRIWCVGSEPLLVVDSSPAIGFWKHVKEPLKDAIRCLVVGACLVMSDPERVKRRGSHGASRTTKHRDCGPPPEGAHYVLAAPVQIDLRDTLGEALGGKHRGGSPKVQFLVRGHWRQQAHGPHHSLRRAQWVHAFWKGDPEARVLLRPHALKEDR